MKKILLLLFLLPAILLSQHALNLTYTQGNNFKSFRQFTSDYGFQYMDSVSKNTFEANVNFIYGSQEGEINSRDITVSIRERLYWGPVEGFMNIQNDQSLARGIDNRITGGVGLEKLIVNKGNFGISLSDGALFELTHFKDLGEYAKVRNSFRIQIKNKGKFKLKSNLMIQNNIQNLSDYILVSNSTLGVPLTSMIDFTAKYSYIQETFIDVTTDFMTFGLEINF